MQQANDLEVASPQEIHCIGLPVCQCAGRHTRGAIEAGAIRRRPWTPPAGDARGLGADLLGGRVLLQEGRRMRLVGVESPGDAIAHMNPQLVWQKSAGLLSLILTLGARERLPLFGLNRLWSDHDHQHQHAAEDGWKLDRAERVHRPSFQEPWCTSSSAASMRPIKWPRRMVPANRSFSPVCTRSTTPLSRPAGSRDTRTMNDRSIRGRLMPTQA